MGFVPDGLACAHIGFQPTLTRAFRISGDADIDLAHQRRYFVARLPKRLSCFSRDQVGQRFVFAPNDIDEAAQRFDAIGDGLRRPSRPARARSGDFRFDIARLPLPKQGTRGGFVGCKRRDHLSRAMPEIG